MSAGFPLPAEKVFGVGLQFGGFDFEVKINMCVVRSHENMRSPDPYSHALQIH